MHRPLLVTAVLGLAAAFAASSCKPSADTFDAGCYPAAISTPADAGVDAGCIAWTSDCSTNGNLALQEAILGAFDSASNTACQADTDCGLYASNGSIFKMQCYQAVYGPTVIALSQRGAIDNQIQAILCGYCSFCYDGGNGLATGPDLPFADAGNCTEASCVSGVCSVSTFQL